MQTTDKLDVKEIEYGIYSYIMRYCTFITTVLKTDYDFKIFVKSI